MIDIYEILIGNLFSFWNSFFITILIVVIINNLIIKFLETYLDKVFEKIKKYDDFIKEKEEKIYSINYDKIKIREDIFRLHEKYSFNPLFRLTYIIPYLIQIPFLISVYFALEKFPGFKGLSFLFINAALSATN